MLKPAHKPLKKTSDNEFLKHVPNNFETGKKKWMRDNTDSFKIRGFVKHVFLRLSMQRKEKRKEKHKLYHWNIARFSVVASTMRSFQLSIFCAGSKIVSPPFFSVLLFEILLVL